MNTKDKKAEVLELLSHTKDSGLIDAVGSRLEAKDALGTLIGVDPSEVIFCEYEPPLIPF